jgi:hypothetical protein
MRSNRVTATREQFRRLGPGNPVLLLALIPLLLASCASSGTPLPTATATASATASASASIAPSPTLASTATPDPTAVPSATVAPTLTVASGVWNYNLYNAAGFRFQNPDVTACTAASAEIMLNWATTWTDYLPLTVGQPAASKPHGWKVDVSYSRMEALLAYERKNGTMLLSWGGADAHGWRNALNYYGWGSTTANVYKDLTYKSFADAVRATVTDIALWRKPVGILAEAGNHAQVVTGYRVKGYDPRTGSTNFEILGVYLSDPYQSNGYVNAYIPLSTLSAGPKHIRFTTYQMTNSPYVDPLDHQQGNAEWDGKWVIVAPIA